MVTWAGIVKSAVFNVNMHNFCLLSFVSYFLSPYVLFCVCLRSQEALTLSLAMLAGL